jgi:hypothetical protein
MTKFSLPIPQFDFVCKARHGTAFGRFSVANNDILARIIYDVPGSYVRVKSPYSLLLENGSIATLFDFRIPSSGTHATAAANFSVDVISANYALIGYNDWNDANKVFRIEFCLAGSAGRIGYFEHEEFSYNSPAEGETAGPSSARIFYHDKVEILKVVGSDMSVTLSKQRQLNAGYTDNDIGTDPTWILIDIPDGVPLREIFQYVFHIRTFFELSAGEASKSVSIAISTTYKSEEDNRITDFSFFERRTPLRKNGNGDFRTDAAFNARNQNERDILQGALCNWINQRKQWQSTYWLASSFVHGGALYDRQRLLQAFAWFESIPDYLVDECVTDKQLRKLRPKIKQLPEFASLNISDKHLADACSGLKRRPLSERMDSAVSDLRKMLGLDLVPTTLETDCKLAKRLRDEAAHGLPDSSDGDFLRYVVATSAIETLAFLATLRRLTLDRETYKGILNQHMPHPFASYRARKLSEVIDKQRLLEDETIAAMKAARAGETEAFESFDELMADLTSDD